MVAGLQGKDTLCAEKHAIGIEQSQSKSDGRFTGIEKCHARVEVAGDIHRKRQFSKQRGVSPAPASVWKRP